jgi:NADH-quinone oxidoreductase subunit C
MSAELLEKLSEELGEAVIETSYFRGDDTALVRRNRWIEVLSFLKERCGMDMLLDLCAADYPSREDRFEVVVHLRSSDSGQRLRVKARCSFADPEIESAARVWKAADWFEREAFDLFGIRFKGHPNLKRLLCHPSFEGHPLRKDFPKGKRGALHESQTLMDEMEALRVDESHARHGD